MKKQLATLLPLTAALFGCHDDWNVVSDLLEENYELTPIEAYDSRYQGDVGPVSDLDVEGAEVWAGTDPGGFTQVHSQETPVSEGALPRSMMILHVWSWHGRPASEVLKPGVRITRAGPEEPTVVDEGDGPVESDDVTVELVGCAGESEEEWYDKPADVVDVTVREGEDPDEVVVEYTGSFDNRDYGDEALPEETVVEGSFRLREGMY